MKRTGATFVTNDWRQLSATTDESFWAPAPLLPKPNEMMTNAENSTGNVHQHGPPSGDTSSSNVNNNLRSMAQDIAWLKQDNVQIKTAVMDLQRDRDNLRIAVRKLKVENNRMKVGYKI